MSAIKITRDLHLVEVGSQPVEIHLDQNREYAIRHTGRAATGKASTGDVIVQATPAVDFSFDWSDSPGKLALTAGDTGRLPPATGRIRVASTAGNVSVQIIPGRCESRNI